jgi:hypothetical protein
MSGLRRETGGEDGLKTNIRTVNGYIYCRGNSRSSVTWAPTSGERLERMNVTFKGFVSHMFRAIALVAFSAGNGMARGRACWSIMRDVLGWGK